MNVKPLKQLSEEEYRSLVRAAESALSDLSWAERTVPGTNFQSSIILLRLALGAVKDN